MIAAFSMAALSEAAAIQNTRKVKLDTESVIERLDRACLTFRMQTAYGVFTSPALARTNALKMDLAAYGKYGTALKAISPASQIEANAAKRLMNFAGFVKAELTVIVRLDAKLKTRGAADSRIDSYVSSATKLAVSVRSDLEAASLPVCSAVMRDSVSSDPFLQEPFREDSPPTTVQLGASRVEVPAQWFPTLEGFTFTKTAGYDLVANLDFARRSDSYQANSVRQIVDGAGIEVGVLDAYVLLSNLDEKEKTRLGAGNSAAWAAPQDLGVMNGFTVMLGLLGGKDKAVLRRGDVIFQLTFVQTPGKVAITEFVNKFLNQLPSA